MAFQHFEFFPGVFHIQDEMGVCMTLLCGKERALLVDTGYGLEDVKAYIATLTNPVDTTILSNGLGMDLRRVGTYRVIDI